MCNLNISNYSDETDDGTQGMGQILPVSSQRNPEGGKPGNNNHHHKHICNQNKK